MTVVNPITEMTPVKVPCYPLETPMMTLVNAITEMTPVKVPMLSPGNTDDDTGKCYH